MTKQLTELKAGMQLIYDGNKLFTVDKELASKFKSGDRLLFTKGESKPILIPSASTELVAKEIHLAKQGFYDLATVSDKQINIFYDTFSSNLANDVIWKNIQTINNLDVKRAQEKGKSTTRLIANNKCRQNMIAGLADFKAQNVSRKKALSKINHDGWSVDLLKSPLGVVGFVFEGRPNVIADATGVLKTGNVGVFRVGQDALQTAKAILELALYPALDTAGISRNVIRILDSPERSTAWALFSNTSVNLAVARGSGQAVRMLGSIAQYNGIPVSLHGTGGAWMMRSKSTDKNRLMAAIMGSLDRKVCNTLNTICLLESHAAEFIPVILNALENAGKKLNQSYKIHVDEHAKNYFSLDQFKTKTNVYRAEGLCEELQFELINRADLGTEFEWEQTPEISIVITKSVKESIQIYNTYSPQFVASLITTDSKELDSFFDLINAPFVGNGMTRWVDGQYALNSPELGLSNWEGGRFLARSAILSGDGVFTTRIKMTQINPELSR